ncbi:MAG TPA: sodium:solute symporter family protein [Verrucomicrobiae bacterium]|nr:sodium:solute symporter family protein [Verrucomicrobiae bacterium]
MTMFIATNFAPWVDGSILGLYLLATLWAGICVRKYVSRVEDYLVAGREMNVYLGIASLAATEFGIITCMFTAQAGYTDGFAGALPGICQAGAMFLIGLTGFCVKPLRDSGAMTLPELFEKRYGTFVRWLAGVVIVLGGLLSVLVTDFLQFVVMSVGLLVVTAMILHQVGWERLVETVERHHGAGGFNPLANPNLGWTFVIMQILGNTAATLTWQTTLARMLSAKDTDTGRKVYTRTSFFFVCRWLIPGLWGIAALGALGWRPLKELTPDELADIPPVVQEKIASSGPGRPLARLSGEETAALERTAVGKLNAASLHAMPRFLSAILPAGLLGIVIAAMLAADMSTDSSYMLGWGSVIYNDILAPFRRRPWSDRRAILWNRCIVALIGVYLFVFGLLYTIEGNVWSYLLLTGAIYLSSMSVLLIACCYWRRANNWGALGAIILGATVPIAHLTMEKLPATAGLAASIGKDAAGTAAFAAAAIGMIAGSLLKPRKRIVP